MKSSIRLVLSVLLILIMESYLHASERESTVCGWFKERFVFTLWSLAVPSPNESRIKTFKYVENVKFTTLDSKKLNGYVYRAHSTNNGMIKAKGYILMALGNAMIADQMIHKVHFGIEILHRVAALPDVVQGCSTYCYGDLSRRLEVVVDKFVYFSCHSGGKHDVLSSLR